MINKILLCVDQSKHTPWNVEYACTLTKKLGAQLQILHIVALPSVVAPEVNFNPQQFIDDAEKFIANVKSGSEKLGVKVTTHIESTYGSASHAVVEYAKKGGFDLIALGAMGTSEIRDLLLGSVAHAVSRHAPCPVLIIRPKK